MSSAYDVLFFSAHPDDAEFSAGGTLLKLAKKYKVVNVILTKGEAGTFGSPEERVKEAECAGKQGGYDIEFMDFRDNFVHDSPENAHKLAEVIRKYKPRIVFSTYHTQVAHHLDGISHPDHAATGKLALAACRFAKFKNSKVKGEAHTVDRIIYYMIPRKAMPSFVVDVSDIVGELPTHWKCHKSQFENLQKGLLVDRLMTSRKATGQMVGLEYAEGFIVEEPVRLDVDDILNI
jgi:N-acetylglucosamine malate deacetylase 1